jgi:hypothetical protein
VRGVGFVRVCASGEKERKQEKIQRSKPLLPLPLRVKGKKKNSAVQNGIVAVFLEKKKRKGNEFGNNSKIGYNKDIRPIIKTLQHTILI